MDLLTAIVTIVISSPLMVVVTHLLNRRARHAETRLKNIEADKNELSNKRTEVEHYRKTIKEIVTDMEALRLAQDDADTRYQEQTNSLHSKIDSLTQELEKANGALVQANKTISELEREVREGGAKTNALITELERANKALDQANQEIKELREEVKSGNGVITALREEISNLLVEREKKK